VPWLSYYNLIKFFLFFHKQVVQLRCFQPTVGPSNSDIEEDFSVEMADAEKALIPDQEKKIKSSIDAVMKLLARGKKDIAKNKLNSILQSYPLIPKVYSATLDRLSSGDMYFINCAINILVLTFLLVDEYISLLLT